MCWTDKIKQACCGHGIQRQLLIECLEDHYRLLRNPFSLLIAKRLTVKKTPATGSVFLMLQTLEEVCCICLYIWHPIQVILQGNWMSSLNFIWHFEHWFTIPTPGNVIEVLRSFLQLLKLYSLFLLAFINVVKCVRNVTSGTKNSGPTLETFLWVTLFWVSSEFHLP